MTDEFNEWLKKCPVEYDHIQEFPNGPTSYIFFPEGLSLADVEMPPKPFPS